MLTGLDTPHLGGDWKPPYDWENGQGPRETAARTRLNAFRAALPPSFNAVVPVALGEIMPFGVSEALLPTLLAQFQRAERSALIRHLQRASTRSKAGRLVAQVGEHGRWFWSQIRSRRQSKRET